MEMVSDLCLSATAFSVLSSITVCCRLFSACCILGLPSVSATAGPGQTDFPMTRVMCSVERTSRCISSRRRILPRIMWIISSSAIIMIRCIWTCLPAQACISSGTGLTARTRFASTVRNSGSSMNKKCGLSSPHYLYFSGMGSSGGSCQKSDQ